ncbi:MAG: S8 family serine peptidase [Candidatus Omnitrophica bacterium]|nr:S8 family serine peptidase [Candidatus Omnitrophota bacterium]
MLRKIRWGFFIFAVCAVCLGRAELYAEGKRPAVPGRIIVQRRSARSGVVPKALSAGRQAPSPWQGILARSDVTAKRLFNAYLPGTGSSKKAVSQKAYIQSIKSSYPLRAKRAPDDVSLPDLSEVYILEFSRDENLSDVLDMLRGDPDVEYAQPDYIIPVEDASSADDINYFDKQWGLEKIQAYDAWGLSRGEGVIVAVVDSGVDIYHSDLAANIWTNHNEIPDNGMDDDFNGCIDDAHGCHYYTESAFYPVGEGDVSDLVGHGTHVAGIIAASGPRVMGVAPSAQIMPLRVDGNKYDERLTGISSSATALAIYYAVANGADVINNSWGVNFYDPENPIIRGIIQFAHGMGVVVVFSSGNDSLNVNHHFPNAMKETITVGNCNKEDRVNYRSNYGALVDICAPGTDVISTVPVMQWTMPQEGIDPSYAYKSGTSMAAPHVSGAAALLLASDPDLSNEDIRQIMRFSADDVEAKGFDMPTGFGRLNAYRALQVDNVLDARITGPAVPFGISPEESPIVEISGFAGGDGFKHYRLFYAYEDAAMDRWNAITDAIYNEVEGGLLCRWNTGGLAPGYYVVRLVVTSEDGRLYEDVIPVSKERYGRIERLTSGSRRHVNPDISGRYIVWERQEMSPDGNISVGTEIILYDKETGEFRAIDPSPADYLTHLQVSGKYVVWRGNVSWPPENDGGIHIYDIDTQKREVIQAPTNDLKLQGGAIFYKLTSEDGRTSRIYAYDIASGENKAIIEDDFLYASSISGAMFVVDGTMLVRVGSDDDYRHFFSFYDLDKRQERRIRLDRLITEKDNGYVERMAASGGRVIWSYRYGSSLTPPGAFKDIYLYDINTERNLRLTAEGNRYSNFSYNTPISQDYAVWSEDSSGYENIYLYDIANRQKHQITFNYFNQEMPVVSGNTIAWQDERNGGWDIYSLDLPQPPVNTVPEIVFLTERYHAFYWRGRDKEDKYKVQYYYRVDGGEWNGPISYPRVSKRDLVRQYSLQEGTHAFEVKAVDQQGGESEVKSLRFLAGASR